MRLNKTIREQIITNWKKEKWDAKIEKAKKAFVKAHRDLFEKNYEKEIKIAAENKRLADDGFLITYKSFYLYKRRNVPLIDLDGHIDCLSYASKNRYSQNEVTIIDSEVGKIEKMKKEFISQRETIESIVYSVTTDTKLLELLPEIKKYIPKKTETYSVVPIDVIKSAKSII